ncbi:histone H2B-like [Helicoverpa armigera]|uniref:histone H2B-like n=1 Tax=Helicoverpa armigera TaxID=29058 RepID=UPI003083D4FF
MEKPIDKPISKSKKMKKKNYQSFSIYLYKLLRAVAKENLGISRKSMLIMNNFVNDMLEKIAEEAGRLVAHSKKTTMSSREIQAAVKLIIPGELSTHANIEAMKAISMYHKSHERDAASKI